MRSVKGPKSALTDFIEENKIKLRNIKTNSSVIVNNKINKTAKKSKKIQYSKPFEAVNFDIVSIKNNDEEIENILENVQDRMIDESMAVKIAVYLSRNRKMNKFFFDLLVGIAVENLKILDCSMIKDSEFVIPKKLKKLELYQCGQMKSETLNFIVRSMPELEVLRITGAFLIEDFEIPKKIRILDVSNCSRLSDEFINNINSNLVYLEELKLSYCYGFSRNAFLSIKVDNLFICETKLSEKFIENVSDVRSLSVKRCPNINNIPNFKNIEYLDVEGIITLEKLPEIHNIAYLNISHCWNIKITVSQKLKHLNLSHTEMNKNQLNRILKCKNLETLDISWNNIVDDEMVNQIIKALNLKKLFVFGCFLLTKKSVDLAYKIKEECLIVGNPSETLYLLNE